MEVHVMGLEELEREIDKMRERCARPDEALAAEGVGMVRLAQQSFGERIDPYGEPWEPLKQESAATGTLERSITSRAEQSLLRVFVDGAAAEYAPPQQARRAFLPLDESGATSFGGGGWAAAWYRDFIRRFGRWIATGRTDGDH